MKRTRSSNALVSNPSKRRRTSPYIPATQKKAIKAELLRQLETKFSYNVSTASAIDYNGTAFELFPTAQGDTGQTVVGNKVTPVYIKVKYSVDLGDTINLITLAVIQWKGGPQHDPPTGSDVWQASGSIIAPLSAWDETNKHNFKVLGVQTHALDTYNPKCVGEFKIHGKYMRPVSYTEGDITAAPRDGGLYLIAISDSAVSTHPALAFYAGIYYKDA